MRFTYSVVRLAPDPARGEFVNVGAIVGSDEAGWVVHHLTNLRRVRAFDDRKVLPAALDFMSGLPISDDGVNAGDDAFSESLLASLSARMTNVVRLSSPAPIIANSLADAVELVTAEMLVDLPQETLAYQRRTAAQHALRVAYVAQGLKRGEDFFEKVTLTAGKHSEPLDFIVANGSAVQLAQAWSFQTPDQDRLRINVRSWGWALRTLRAEGGTVRNTSNRSIDVASDVDVEVVCLAPLPQQLDSSAFADAQGVFGAVNATVRLVDQVEMVAASASESLLAHNP